MSLPVYVLVLLAFRRPESAEAALKYLVLGGTATAHVPDGRLAAVRRQRDAGALGLRRRARLDRHRWRSRPSCWSLVAFFLKAAIVPFHAWAPDAYEGASVPVTAYMATIIKAGVLLAALRLFGTAPVSRPDRRPARDPAARVDRLGQSHRDAADSFRRMIAYSSIAHAGYLFYAFLGDGPGRFQAVVFYLLAYGLMNLLAFASIPRGDDDTARDRLDDMHGLFQRGPYAAVMIGIAMLSLAGIPPFPGFVAKFLIFKNVMAAGFTTYAVLGLVGSYLGIYFYLRVIQFLFMSPEPAGATRVATGRVRRCWRASSAWSRRS